VGFVVEESNPLLRQVSFHASAQPVLHEFRYNGPSADLIENYGVHGVSGALTYKLCPFVLKVSFCTRNVRD
jgi:hypothetical protein